MNEHLLMFKQHLCVLNRSKKTVKTYVEQVDLFLKQADVADVRNVSTRNIRSYIADLYDHIQPNGKPYSTSTICLKIRAIKRFFEYLEANKLIFIDPTEGIKEPKHKTNDIKSTLTPDEAEMILEQPDLSTQTGIRDRAVLEVLYSTGIRREELQSLSIHDVDLAEAIVRINNGKGAKDRVVPLGNHAARFVSEYVTKVRPELIQSNPSNQSLFINRFGNPLSLQMIGIIVKTNAKKAGIKKRVTPHTFRHTFATTLIKNNADIRAVQAMMGHAEIKSTQKYTRIVNSDVKQVHTKTHPRERDSHLEDINTIL